MVRHVRLITDRSVSLPDFFTSNDYGAKASSDPHCISAALRSHSAHLNVLWKGPSRVLWKGSSCENIDKQTHAHTTRGTVYHELCLCAPPAADIKHHQTCEMHRMHSSPSVLQLLWNSVSEPVPLSTFNYIYYIYYTLSTLNLQARSIL